MAGNKRAAVSSPSITPPGAGTTQQHSSTDDPPNEYNTEWKPARLEDKYGVPPRKKSISTNHTSNLKDEDQSGKLINLLNPGIYEDLLSEPSPPKPGDWLPYEFDEEHEATVMVLCQLNGLKLEEALRQKILRCKQQDRSQAHPKWNPFRLEVHKDEVLADIINCKGKKALTFQLNDYFLDTGDLLFDTYDAPTYTLLCYVGPKMVVTQVAKAKKKTVKKVAKKPAAKKKK
jgi:hypothetical protein